MLNPMRDVNEDMRRWGQGKTPVTTALIQHVAEGSDNWTKKCIEYTPKLPRQQRGK